ncbi:MAG: hypothetical protein ABL307_06895 [Roseitalea porphyridii]|uniref:hypothetical protein n=1 Tax=Roseitalea porphyridii TaxID=1852022 RepID=UPI0032D8FDC9
MDISRSARKPEATGRCGAVIKGCLDCKDCNGPCLLYAELYGRLALIEPGHGLAA